MSLDLWVDIAVGLGLAIAGGLLGHSVGWDRGYNAAHQEGVRRG